MSQARNTVQREAVLQAVAQLQGHATAEMIYEQIHSAHPLISKATVYRNLKALEHQGKIMKISVPDGADSFELQTRPHYHIKCIGCGRVFDAALPYLPRLLSLEQKADRDFALFSCTILFEGLCPECNQTEEKTVRKKPNDQP